MASRLALSSSASWSGLVMIQLVTALTFGGAGRGAGTAAFPRKRARYWRTCGGRRWYPRSRSSGQSWAALVQPEFHRSRR